MEAGSVTQRWWKDPLWLQAVASFALVLATLGLIGVTDWYVQVTDRMMKAQVEVSERMMRAQVDPLVELELPAGEGNIAIRNDGAYPVVDVSINVDTLLLMNHRPTGFRMFTGARVAGWERHDWWHIERLNRWESQTHSIEDLVRGAVQLMKNEEERKARGQLLRVSPQQRVRFDALLVFKMVVHREVDLKPFQKVKKAMVFRDSNTGKGFIWDADLMDQEISKRIFEVK